MNFLILLLVFPAFVFCQKQKDVALKVYVKDAETGETIPDAKVMLEGYDIPPIEGRYNKKWGYYYFKEIPTGYNTVMAYHDEYNEKGFQDVNGLPKELTLKVYDYRFVSYSFEEPVLRRIENDYLVRKGYLNRLYDTLHKKDSVTDKNFKYLYTEDPYHIAIISKADDKEFFSNDSLKALLNALSLEETVTMRMLHKGGYQSYCYGITESGFCKGQYHLRNGKKQCNIYTSSHVLYRIYFFHKKNRTAFSRYNCKEIQELSKLNLKVASLTYRVIEYYANTRFNPTSFYQYYDRNIHYQAEVDKYDFEEFKEPRQFFFKNPKKDNKMYFGKEKQRIFYGPPSDDCISGVFFVVAKNNASVGLGALDFDTKDNKDFRDYFHFFNYGYDIDFGLRK